MISDFLQKFPTYIGFIAIILLMALIMYRAHVSSDNHFSMFDLIEDSSTGKGALEKVGMLMAMLTLTWWFIDMCAKTLATWEVAATYASAMGVWKVANKYLELSKPKVGE